MKLFCPVCQKPTNYKLAPWQWVVGKFGSIAAMCDECFRLEVLTLGEGKEIEAGDKPND